ncbi:MAG: hypothetical protein ACO1PM_25330 [Acidovorax sp.]
MSKVKFTRAKAFEFLRPDGGRIEIPVPPDWNQRLVSLVDRNDYTVNVVVSSKPPAEASFSTLAIGSGHTAGFIIPGAAILSPDNPNASDANYSAYNLLIADIICRASRDGNYLLASSAAPSAESRHNIFRQNACYLITWNKYFNSPSSIYKDFAISLCHHGLVFSISDGHPKHLYVDYEGDGTTMRIKSTAALPSYVTTILGSLIPYCDNPFLRFFYLYQVIEHMMGMEFESKVADVRNRLAAIANPSMVELREILEKFQDATREKTRINAALVPQCPATAVSVEKLLAAVNALDPDTSFAERIYRVRNILFHDYKQLHEKGEQISLLCGDLFAYLVSKKLLI